MNKLLLTLFSLGLSALSHAGNVIFVHPDGAGLAHWQAARFLQVGPDGDLNWDKIPQIAVYRGHVTDCLTATSNAGAVAHAYGVRVDTGSFGFSEGEDQAPVTESGKRETLMQEAIRRGVRTGLVNSGSIIEPGTAVFVAATEKREMYEQIAGQVLSSGVDIILSGGEQWMLPEGAQGRHGAGKRKDGRNLIEEAREAGYEVVFNREELAAVPAGTDKLLGVFAEKHTFYAMPEIARHTAGLPLYVEAAPTVGEMTDKALELLDGSHFFLVVEEEGSDNFPNKNNSPGTLEALRRADEALGVARDFVAKSQDTLLITTADSEAAGMDVIGLKDGSAWQEVIAKNGRDRNGAPYGLTSEGEPFLSSPDADGKTHKFVIAWTSIPDTSGGILVRAEGQGAEKVKGTVHNVDVYRIMREALFGLD